MAAPVTIRPAAPQDTAFVMASWLNGYRYGSGYGRSQRNRVFFHDHHQVIEGILSRPTTVTLVAIATQDPSVAVGFLVHERPNVLHWVYVKDSFRRLGVARLLLSASNLPYTLALVELSHVSDDWFDFGKRTRPEALYRHSRQYRPAAEDPLPARDHRRQLAPRQPDRVPRQSEPPDHHDSPARLSPR